MKESVQPTGWLLARLLRRPRRPGRWAAVVVLLVAVIGYFDYLLGPHISLRIFYVMPVALAVSWYGWWPAVATSLASVFVWLASDYFAGALYVRRPEILWNASLVLAMYLLIARILRSLIELRQDLEERVRQRTAALEHETGARIRLQRELLRMSERERSSIGRDLHDGLCQHLAGTALAGKVLAEQLEGRDPGLAAQAARIVELVEDGIAQTRTLANGLLLSSIEPDLLIGELEKLAATVHAQHGVACTLTVRGDPRAPDDTAASHLFRIAQEAVRNAVRHAHPSRLDIVLSGHGAELTLSVSDNGPGLPRKRNGAGMGLRIMAHRAEIIRGEFALEPAAGGGTRVRCSIGAH